MVIINHRITIINYRNPLSQNSNINVQLQRLGNSLGLFNMRDKDKSCFRLFIELIKTAKHHTSINSDELAYRLGLSRGTVIHHMNKLMEAGIVISKNSRYMLRVENLKELIELMEKDIKKTLLELKDIAQDIDTKLGL